MTLALASTVGGNSALAAYPAAPQITDRYSPGAISLRLTDFAVLPKSGASSTVQVARPNFMRAEPVPALAASRLFVPDLNGRLYVRDRSTKTFNTFLNMPSIFNGAGGSGTFDADPGYAAGLVTVAFDPAYAANGKFYTVHTELTPAHANNYRAAVLTEWHDTNINDAVFTGTHQQLLRADYTGNIHPLGDITFNPQATTSAHPDWRNMYISGGDGGAGESPAPTRHTNQLLNNFAGKVLRIRPTPSGTPGTYTVPAGNPFVSAPAEASPEIYAYGFRNPHRLAWDVDGNGVARLLVNDIGLHAYEEVNLVEPGKNYGYSRIEGNQVLGTNNFVNNNALPGTLPIYVSNTTTSFGNIAPTYPLAMYSHRDGDAIAGGFVYRGTLMPQLRGKYVFGDITTGRLFWSDLTEMLAAGADGNPLTQAPVHELNLFYNDPRDADPAQSRRVFDLVRDTFDLRNETSLDSTGFDGSNDNDNLPGGAAVTGGLDPYGVAYGGGRADIRFALIDDELYLISKTDGMIRAISSAAGDANLDGIVNFSDLLVIAKNYNTAANATWAAGDFNMDGSVNFPDLLILARHYGMGSLAAGSDFALAQALVPEPAVGALVLAGAMALRRPRR